MFVVLKRKQIVKALIIAVVFVSCVVCLSFADVDRTVFAKSTKKLPVYRVDNGEDNAIAISFDAAWGADKTKRIVDLLTERNLKATFFLVGFWADAYKEEVAYIADNGMEIGNHSKNHLHMNSLDEVKTKEEIEYVNHAVRTLTGVTPKVFRAPFGEYDDKLISCVEECGMTAVQWDVDSLDWKGISGAEIIKRVVGKVKSGSIILCHNNSDHILDALPTILDELTAKGYKFVTVGELLYKDNYTIDAQGVQHKNK
ncbi:MAG: polysaccharide deacetylase family protein [Clostridia bacterium]|nr:polysaccharide deacetylase family protein [Clostridia bacterium]